MWVEFWSKLRRKSAALPLQRRRRRLSEKRGVALVLVLGSLAILAVMLTEFQDETSADLGHALAERDGTRAEFAARSAVNLSRLLIASEPTIRKAIAPLFMMMRSGPPQIPVWAFADQVLGAFNDGEGQKLFKGLGGFDLSESKNLGLGGAGFEVVVVDEDSKLNFNLAAKGDAFSQQRLATQILGLVAGPQFSPLFDERDSAGDFNSRQDICSAIIDWTDPDQDISPCDISGQFVASGSEDSYYQLLDPPYQRKNAALDSLEELHLVRGVSDDFWAAFVEPRPADPKARSVTVWGQGKVNVNSANAQTILGLICGSAVDGTKLCSDAEEQMKFLSVVGLLTSMLPGIPVFPSPKAFVSALQGGGMFGSVMKALEMEPIKFRSDDELGKAITTESKVFSVYATGVVTGGKRRTVRRVHAVVDFRGAPAPLDPFKGLTGEQPLSLEEAQTRLAESGPKPELPEGASEESLANAFKPDPAGRVIYFRVE
jgi:general secretion pathway protein K